MHALNRPDSLLFMEHCHLFMLEQFCVPPSSSKLKSVLFHNNLHHSVGWGGGSVGWDNVGCSGGEMGRSSIG